MAQKADITFFFTFFGEKDLFIEKPQILLQALLLWNIYKPMLLPVQDKNKKHKQLRVEQFRCY